MTQTDTSPRRSRQSGRRESSATLAPITAAHDHREEAERAVLGAMMVNPSTVPLVSQIIAGPDFYRAANALVFNAILAVAEDAEADPITVAAELSRRSQLELAGGSDNLHVLYEFVPAAANAARYAEIVLEASLRRRMATATTKLAMALDNNDAVSREVALKELEELRASAGVRAGRVGVRSYTAVEVTSLPIVDPDPVVLYVERGCIFDLVSKAKGGKTTLILHGCRALLNDEPFLGLLTKRVPILYLTEQTRRSFRDKLEGMGLAREQDLHVLFRCDFAGKSWSQICDCIRAEVVKWGIGLLIIDTLSDWAKVEDENDNAEALRVTAPLREIAEQQDVAAWTVRHTGRGRNFGQDVVDMGRGASAFAGIVDVACVLERAPGNGHPDRRQLRLAGRKDGIPKTMVVELTNGRYEALGDAPNVEYRVARDFVLERLRGDEDAATTEKEILDAGRAQFSRSTLKRVLNSLMREGIVTGKLGAGSASGKAHGYWLLDLEG